MQKFISHIRHSSNTDLFPPQNINKRSYGSLIQKIKCWNVHPAMLPSTSRYPVGGGKNKTNTTQMSSQKKTFSKEQGEIQSHSSGWTVSYYKLQIFSSVCLSTARTCGENLWHFIMVGLGEGRGFSVRSGSGNYLLFSPVLQHVFSFTANVAIILPTESWLAETVLN